MVGVDRVGARDQARSFRSVHRRRPQSVAHALQGKLVLRIEVQRGAELSHRFHRLILEQVFVPLFE